ncbi:MFS transporter [Kitasatospora sp. NPDC058965]|uniref:MFS transporter n=1 Tax=Kitasatospora sp. NPDC058965 TaxID=3346682 RepID=UPI0036A3AA46
MTTASAQRRRLRLPHAELWRTADFRWFFSGYATSLLGSAMAPVALAFAVLHGPGGTAAFGLVLTARILPLVLVLLLGGVAADRLGSRPVMLTADTVRCLAQAGFAAALLAHGPLWTLLVLAALGGAGEAVFGPALAALIPRIAPAERLTEANALFTLARSGATVAGPALAGLLTAGIGPAPVLALDAASYAVSVLALSRLTVRAAAPQAAPGLLRELREGWGEFRSRTWLWVSCLHGCLFNLLCWAPYLVLGPAISTTRLGGAWAWGLVTAGYGAGAVLGALALLGGRRPARPVLVSTVAMAGFALPSGALALGAPLPLVCLGALGAGVASSVAGTLYSTAQQRMIPAAARARVDAYGSLGAFALGPVGLALAGPVAALLGSGTVLALGALWQLAATAAVLAVPAVRGN